MSHGPMYCSFTVYNDFFSYDTATAYEYDGVSDVGGGHAVTCYGWGPVQGVDAWHCINSWGGWGQEGKGIFYIKKGVNTANIESNGISTISPLYLHRQRDPGRALGVEGNRWNVPLRFLGRKRPSRSERWFKVSLVLWSCSGLDSDETESARRRQLLWLPPRPHSR